MTDPKTNTSTVPGVDNFKRLYEDNAGRVGELLEEVGKAHGKWIEYGNTQIDEMNEVLKTQFNFVNDLAAGFRKLSIETFKKSLETMAK